MTHEANILSFNEVKARGTTAPRTVSSRRAAHASKNVNSFSNSSFSNQNSRKSRFASDDYTFGITSDYHAINSGLKSSSDLMRGGSGSSNYSNANHGNLIDRHHGDLSFAKANRSGVRGSSSSGSNYGTGATTGSHVGYHQGYTRTSRASRNVRGIAHELHSDENRSNSERVSAGRPARSSAKHVEKEGFFKKLQKHYRSVKADRAFDRTEGVREHKAQAQAAQANSSRAAVYEMHMGSTHRKSARMQDHDEKKKGIGLSLPFNLPAMSLSAAATRGLVALAVVGLTVFMLYPTCQSYYTETRQLQQLQAEYDALNAYNAQMQSQINYLNTEEGLEEYARSELGLIRQDEHMVTVEGVESSSDGASASDTAHSPLNETIPAPDTWYSGFLDVFFGYGK